MRTISLLLSLCFVAGCCDFSFAQMFQRRQAVTYETCTGPNCQSAQQFYPSSVVVQSPVVVPSSVTVSSVQSVAPVSSASILANDRAVFRRAFMKSLKAAKQSGAITDLEYLRLVTMSLRPASLDKIRETVQETAIQEGLATATAINWDGLIAFMEKLIPLIIKLIDLFS
jgi:hypothetical protein